VVTLTRWKWVPSLGIEFHLLGGRDQPGAGPAHRHRGGGRRPCSRGTSSDRANEFFALYLLLIGGVYGVFLSFDLFLLFFFYEVAIVPKYFLIAIWGSTRREYGAMKLALYSFIGSALVFIGILAVVRGGGPVAREPDPGPRTAREAGFPAGFQRWAFPLIFVGFAILAGLWPFHTWAPTGHVAAPTAASMLLAGVVMKLGAYGALRVAWR
jgi:NADH-quinone oxidoreductase subunit M